MLVRSNASGLIRCDLGDNNDYYHNVIPEDKQGYYDGGFKASR